MFKRTFSVCPRVTNAWVRSDRMIFHRLVTLTGKHITHPSFSNSGEVYTMRLSYTEHCWRLYGEDATQRGAGYFDRFTETSESLLHSEALFRILFYCILLQGRFREETEIVFV